ncbi:MAG: DegT/DnrJ/EryC1/StrS family aminotransferase, partial [Candidatus Thorarchaeota archaeon]
METRKRVKLHSNGLNPILIEEIKHQVGNTLFEGSISSTTVALLEIEWARQFDFKHAIACGSAGIAMAVALYTTQVVGKDVLIPAIAPFHVPNAVVMTGNQLHFCDIDPPYHLTGRAVAEYIADPKTKVPGAVIGSHYCGEPFPNYSIEPDLCN